MSSLSKTLEMGDSAQSSKDYEKALDAMLWDAVHLQTMIADFCNIAADNEATLTLSNNGLRGLALLLEHCSDLAINAHCIAINSRHGLKAVVSHE